MAMNFIQIGAIQFLILSKTYLNVVVYRYILLVNIRFFINKSIFMCFIFVFASSAPFYNTGGHTQLVKFRSLDSFLNEKNEN